MECAHERECGEVVERIACVSEVMGLKILDFFPVFFGSVVVHGKKKV